MALGAQQQMPQGGHDLVSGQQSNAKETVLAFLEGVEELRHTFYISLIIFHGITKSGRSIDDFPGLPFDFIPHKNRLDLDSHKIKRIVNRIRGFKPELVEFIEKHMVNDDIPLEKVPVILREYWEIHEISPADLGLEA